MSSSPICGSSFWGLLWNALKLWFWFATCPSRGTAFKRSCPVEWEKCFPRSSFTAACTNLTQKADVWLFFPPRKEWRRVSERVLASQWTFSYFQILLGNREANYIYDKFSNCFSCRITNHKVMKAWMEKSLPFKLEAVQRRYWISQRAAAELPYCYKDQATLKTCSRTHPTPEQIPTPLMEFASKKHPYNTPQGTQKTRARLSAEVAL